MTSENMADQIVRILASGARVEEVHVMPDPPTPEEAAAIVEAAAAFGLPTEANPNPQEADPA
jgi:hypothetical protein